MRANEENSATMRLRRPTSSRMVCADSSKSASNCWRALAMRALQRLDRHLDRRQRILDLVRDALRDLAPRGDALGAHQLIARAGQIAGHRVEGGGQLADLVARAHRHRGVEAAARRRRRRRRRARATGR